MKCLIDNTEHESTEAMHRHLRRFRVKLEDYYTNAYQRKDRLTGEPIPFKNVEQYMSQDFLDKKSLKKWVKQNPVEGRAWAIEWLKKRKEEKGLVYAPSQVELKSLTGLSMHEYEGLGGYEKACEEADLICRYDISGHNPAISGQAIETVLVDSREQNPLKIEGVNLVRAALKVGDYGLPDPHDKGIYIERKSLSDFIGTLSQGIGRFTRELERAQLGGHYLVMLVEDGIAHALSFNYLPHIKRHVKTTPAHIFKGLRDLLTLYPLTFQCLFVDGRIEAAETVRNLLSRGDEVKTRDLQFEHESAKRLIS